MGDIFINKRDTGGAMRLLFWRAFSDVGVALRFLFTRQFNQQVCQSAVCSVTTGNNRVDLFHRGLK